jgi:hypothetical protein
MPEESEGLLTRVTRQSAEILHNAAEAAANEFFRIGPGQEEVSAREFNADVRRAAEGHEGAQESIEYLARENGHEDNEVEPCPVCAGINEVLRKEGAGDGRATH